MRKIKRTHRDEEKIRAAAKKMDAIRKRFSAKLPPSDSTAIIRKFRGELNDKEVK